MANFFLDNDDLRFQFEHAFDWSEIVRLTELDFEAPEGFRSEQEATEFYRDVLENVGEYVANEIAPKAQIFDERGCSFADGEVSFCDELDRIFKELGEMGLYGLTVPRELGGLNAPLSVYMALNEMVARADVSVMTHFGFHGGMAMAFLAFAAKEGSVETDGKSFGKTRFDREVREIVEGKAFGAMVLTEPDAGSDLAILRTRGVERDGRWYLTGEKIFITSGHAPYHFVLAKTEADKEGLEGLQSLSLFLCRRFVERDGERVKNFEVARIEEKMGHHASPTCAIVYDESEAELIGERGQGFELMLLLMNGARVGVGFEGVGLAEAALRLAREYAAGRTSMGKTIDRHEMIADYLEEMESDVRGMRALAFKAAYYVELYNKLELYERFRPPASELERQRLKKRIESLKWKARELTPLLKYISAEKAVEIARRGLQIHGGVGFTREYLAEKLMRDSMVLPIYEGTSQIQALMATKDHLLGTIRDPQRFVRHRARAQWRMVASADPLERQLGTLENNAYSALQHIITRIAKDKLQTVAQRPMTDWAKAFLKDWDPRRDFAYGLLHAERLTRLLADMAIGRILFEQAQRFPERREVARTYLERALPRSRFLLDEIHHQGDRLLARLANGATRTDKEQAA
ncbi:MAG: acyl-CoA dehydrogenase family protein [Myxococcales bacterium]|nr:acyl-CoA dehydrogenase family protein [Myxococcales bacterium]